MRCRPAIICRRATRCPTARSAAGSSSWAGPARLEKGVNLVLKNPDLILKLALLGVGVVIIGCLTVLIAFGHDGILVDTFMGIAGVIFGANVWQVRDQIIKK